MGFRDIGIVGAACRLPGAPDEFALAEVLNQGRFMIGQAPRERWNPERLFHPDKAAPGSAYSFAGGYIDAPYDFDISMFNMSPREAEQADPQQRLVAELVWEALENAWIRPETIAGKDVGVYIGVSSLDHSSLFVGDPAAIETHFMTGNTLSVVANRISYLFDLKGPSYIIDTACSSSLVAVDRAIADLQSGRTDMAIVGGVNMLLSPASFVGFSRAQMLSPTGACRPFSGEADGYVRAEGGVVFILQRSDEAAPGAVRAHLVGSGVSSDGRTSGIALPGLDGQRSMLQRVYDEVGLAPDRLAFVEAHGTGTVVGDPIEATAIGEVLGQKRTTPLPIGSIKSNIGHLEPASGVAGMMKALIALEQRELPRSLHLDSLNPHVDFGELNLLPAKEAVTLDSGELYCGVSSFGFGGTNAHVVMRSAEGAPTRSAKPKAAGKNGSIPPILIASAQSKESLRALAGAYADRIEAGADAAALSKAAAHGRAGLRRKFALPVSEAGAAVAALRTFADGKNPPAGALAVETGSAMASKPSLCFVFNGNGAQWVGMGREAYAANETFRAGFDAADAALVKQGTERLFDLLHDPELEQKLMSAAVAQPLNFAIQMGLTEVLAANGIRPDLVLGHSLGEITAAHVAGAISLDQAAKILLVRPRSQESVRGKGTMAVVAADRAKVEEMLAAGDYEKVSIAADNSRNSVTVSGETEALADFCATARRAGVASRRLTDVDYPFHSPLLDEIEGDFRTSLGVVEAGLAKTPFYSTVDGDRLEAPLDLDYWWRNVRCPVRFREAIHAAARDGANVFIEIGPRSIVASNIATEFRDSGEAVRVIKSLEQRSNALADDLAGAVDPLQKILARLAANGIRDPDSADEARSPVDRSLDLPRYPWHRRTLVRQRTSGAIDLMGQAPLHPLIGSRLLNGGSEWVHVLDPDVVPYLADHVVGGEVLVPAAAMVEMALAVAREVNPDRMPALEDFDILMPMVLSRSEQLEVRVRYSSESSTCSIHSRPRVAGELWMLHAVGKIGSTRGEPRLDPACPEARSEPLIMGSAIYSRARRTNLDYGPSFRLVRSARKMAADTVVSDLNPAKGKSGAFGIDHVLHPASLDAAMHGMLTALDEQEHDPDTWLPVRFGRVRMWRDNPVVARSTIRMVRDTPTLKTVDLTLTDAEGTVVGQIDGLLMRLVPAVRQDDRRTLGQMIMEPAGLRGAVTMAGRLAAAAKSVAGSELPDAWYLLRAHLDACLTQALTDVADDQGEIDPAAVIGRAQDDPEAAGLIAALLDEAVDSGIAGLCDDGGNRCLKLVKSDIPVEPDAILAACVEAVPTAAADVALSALAATALGPLLIEGRGWKPRGPLVARHRTHGLKVEALADAMGRMMRALLDDGCPTPHVVLAESAIDPLLSCFAPLVMERKIRLSLLPVSDAARERLAFRANPLRTVAVLDPSANVVGDADLVVACSTGEAMSDAALEALGARLGPNGAVLAIKIAADRLTLFQRAEQGRDSGLAEAETSESAARVPLVRTGESLGEHFSFAFHGPDPAAANEVPEVTISGNYPALAKALTKMSARAFDGAPKAPLWLIDGTGSTDAAVVADLIQQLRLHVIEGEAAERREPQWIAVSGPAAAAAVRAFQRVAQNEFAAQDLRLIEIDRDCAPDQAASAILSIIHAPGAEREWSIGGDGVQVARFVSGIASYSDGAFGRVAAAHLSFPQTGNLESFRWQQTERRSPGDGEVEIEVLAVGLNFRDVMLALGALGDDVLDGGQAGAVYGMECSGRVIAVGANVDTLAVGDKVLGFAQDCFSTSLVTSASGLVKIPVGLSAEAAAGLPVAFVTAWHSLVDVARLKAGEKVLIHGGAGGVGLAAIQIAKAIGAEVVATVSSPDKEALARLYGAAHVYASRSLEFGDRVRDDHGGVDVVLNSLSGDAMRESIKCLRPRGRFIELGKRDYVTNSLIALRPFRRNLSYFGVDLDQLLALEPEIAERGVQAFVEGLEDGTYLPLPTNVFDADGVSEAFRLMQSAGHVGKIVIRPPAAGTIEPTLDAEYAPGKGAHLVVGGTRGFGLATALWLAERGAKTIYVASRGGAIDPAYDESVKALARKGVVMEALALDVSDAAAVDQTVKMIVTRCGKLEGVWHTAVELQDGLIEGIEEDGLRRSLAAKVDGAANLDQATQGLQVERFVVFSSASALIGNPGQGAYAAANGYIEGLCRARRAKGLPALAIEWGAITDVGLLADKVEILDNLDRIAGLHGMTSGEALAQLGRILAVEQELTDPVVACARFAHGGALRSLPVAVSPAFSYIFDRSYFEGHSLGASLREMIADKDEGEARQIVLSLLTHEVASILRLSAQEVDPDSTIDTLGMDSLMALELRMALEAKYGVELPLMAVTAVGNLRDLSAKLVAMAQAPAGAPGQAAAAGDGAAEPASAISAVEERLLHMHGGARPDGHADDADGGADAPGAAEAASRDG